MPELPEVETIRLELIKSQIIGEKFKISNILWQKSISWPAVSQFSKELNGQRIERIERLGKSLVFHLDQGCLALHLRMSGKLILGPCPPQFLPYLRIAFFIGKKELHFIDPRKFARVQLQKKIDDLKLPKGPDLLALAQNQSDWHKVLKGLTKGQRAIKAALLDQDLIAGIGNIYADETLYRAGLNPMASCDDLKLTQAEKLILAAQEIVSRAIDLGGTSLGASKMNFQSALGKPGRYQDHLQVYSRYGLPCRSCQTKIDRMKITQRTSHFCPQCQKIPINWGL